MSSKWTIREARPDDAEGIGQLHNEIYKKVYGRDSGTNVLWSSDPQSWWKWSNVDSPAKRSYAFVAEDASKIIGHDAGRGIWFNFNGKKELAVISWGTMTHPAYMRQGISRSLLRARDKRMRHDGVSLAYSIVTELGHLAYLRSGAQDLGLFTTLIKVINPWSYVRKRTGSKILANIAGVPLDLTLKLWNRGNRRRRQCIENSIIEISFFDSRFDCLWEKTKGVFPISIWKDSEYLNWRYVSRPNANYKILAAQDGNAILGYIVLKCIDGEYCIGQIVDLLFLPEKEACASLLLRAAIDYLRNSGADIATSQMFEHSLYFKFLASHGFMRRGQGYRWMVHKLTYVGTIDMFDIRNWYLAQGDTE